MVEGVLDGRVNSSPLRSEMIREGRILLIDDEEDNLRVLDQLLRAASFQAVVSTQDPREALDLFLALEPDLVVLDLRMPRMDGFEVMAQLSSHIPDTTYLPFLIITGDEDPDTRKRALQMGAKDFLIKPFEAGEVLLRIKNLLETRFLHRALRRHNETLEEKVRERTHELAEAQVEILRRLAIAAEYRDDITGQHAERVGVMSALLAQELGLHRQEVKLIRRAAPLHDVGKIGIPDSILMKPGPLTPEEFEVMKGHTQIGARILSGSQYSLLEVARRIADSHHERWDGEGYTPGLQGDEIPLVGRIVAVADVYDSLTHKRPYKGAFPKEIAVERVRAKRGNHFDPRVVDAFETLLGRGLIGELPEMRRGLEPDLLYDNLTSLQDPLYRTA